MNDKIIVAIITSIFTLIGIIVGLIVSSKLSKKTIEAENQRLVTNIQAENERLKTSIKSEIFQSNKTLSVQYITNKRVDWIYAVREELSKFISLAYFIADKYKVSSDINKKVPVEIYRSINKSIAKLKLLFNFSGERDNEIIKLIDKIGGNVSLGKDEFQCELFTKYVKLLTKKSQIYLKLEWERVKLEVNGNLSKGEIERQLDEKAIELNEKIKKNKIIK